jgi:hypothetical protein
MPTLDGMCAADVTPDAVAHASNLGEPLSVEFEQSGSARTPSRAGGIPRYLSDG